MARSTWVAARRPDLLTSLAGAVGPDLLWGCTLRAGRLAPAVGVSLLGYPRLFALSN